MSISPTKTAQNLKQKPKDVHAYIFLVINFSKGVKGIQSKKISNNDLYKTFVSARSPKL